MAPSWRNRMFGFNQIVSDYCAIPLFKFLKSFDQLNTPLNGNKECRLMLGDYSLRIAETSELKSFCAAELNSLRDHFMPITVLSFYENSLNPFP